MKRTKIVATIGPTSESKDNIEKLIDNGMNVARLNFSHGSHQWHEKAIKNIRRIAEEKKIPIGILADLQGPRIRIKMKSEFAVKREETVLITDISHFTKQSETTRIIYLDYPHILKDIKKGNNILIEDGLINLKIVKKSKDFLEAVVISGGILRDHKSVNIPGAYLEVDSVTPKDEKDLSLALFCDVDFIGLSFVREAKDIKCLKERIVKILKRKSSLPQIVAKIETKEAIDNFSSILKETDAVMVARGDLGIEFPEVGVPIMQKQIIDKCLRSAKPVIVATQMLNSMIENSRPTRAEVSDVSNAVIDHADAVMLSGETANGRYPVLAVKTMKEIIEITEKSPFDDLVDKMVKSKKSSISASIADAAHELAKNSGAKAIIAASISGFTARVVARYRPEKRLIVMTNNIKTYNQLSLIWGVESHILPDCKDLDELINRSIQMIKRKKLLPLHSRAVIVTGRPHTRKEHMSLVKVQEII